MWIYGVRMTTSISLTISTSFGDVPLTADERGNGRPVVILHGGAGPVSVAGFADLLADSTGTRVIVPTHPGFGGTRRPEALTSIDGLAEVYAGLLDSLELEDATVIGNSMGGWIASELALRHPARLGRVGIVDGVGIEVEGHPVAGSLAPAQLAEYSWYDPSKAPSLDPSKLPPAAQEIFAGNRAALALYGGTMSDPTLQARLASVDVPALVLWGEADRIADAEYGRAFAAAIPGARFELLPHTGHVPQMETPEVLLEALRAFVDD
jgi:pimeloyl-ACP methyl ester carboxylesterase